MGADDSIELEKPSKFFVSVFTVYSFSFSNDKNNQLKSL